MGSVAEGRGEYLAPAADKTPTRRRGDASFCVLIPFQACPIDAGDVQPTVLIQIDRRARSRSHTAFVQNRTSPLRAGMSIEVHTVRRAPEAGDDFVIAVVIEVGGLNGVAVRQR